MKIKDCKVGMIVRSTLKERTTYTITKLGRGSVTLEYRDDAGPITYRGIQPGILEEVK